jgi:hypothetical protein
MRLRRLSLGAVALGLGLGLAMPATAHAAKSGTCVAFAADLNGITYSGKQSRTFSASEVNGKTMFVHGTFVEFSVALDTFAVTDYTLTGAPSKKDITGGKRTVIFASRTPQLGANLVGNLTFQLANETILLKRGTSQSIKITAKDCPQGGIFQMEAEPGTTYVHVLASPFTYYTDDLGRTLYTNTVFPGRESPELATLVSRTDTSSTWSVPSGGRMGVVLGEDATK